MNWTRGFLRASCLAQLTVATLIGWTWAAPPLAASSWCSCLPAISAADCDGDSACLDAIRQVGEAERMLEQECLPDSDCRAAVAEICSQVCAAIQGMDLSGGGASGSQEPARSEPTVKRPPPRELEEKAKEKSAAEKALDEKTAKEKEADAKAEEARQRECKELVAYRDGGLYRDWELQERKYTLAKEGLESARRLRDEINDMNWWTLSSIPDIALALKITTGVIETTLAAVSPGGSVVALGKSMADTGVSATRLVRAEQVYDALKTGKKVRDIVQKSSDELVYIFVLEKLGAVGATLKGLKTLEGDIRLAQTLGKDKNDYRRTLQEQTARLESEMRRYESGMATAVRSRDVINATKEGIDRYCSKNKAEGVAVPLP